MLRNATFCETVTDVATLWLTLMEDSKTFFFKVILKNIIVTQFHVQNHNYILLLISGENANSQHLTSIKSFQPNLPTYQGRIELEAHKHSLCKNIRFHLTLDD